MGEFLGISVVFLLKRGIKHSAAFGSNIKFVSIDNKGDDTVRYRWQDPFPPAAVV